MAAQRLIPGEPIESDLYLREGEPLALEPEMAEAIEADIAEAMRDREKRQREERSSTA